LPRRRSPGAPAGGGDFERGATRRLIADRGDGGQRIDRVLLRRLGGEPGVSRTRIQRWIAQGRVRLAGRVPAKPSARVMAGDAVEIDLPPAAPRATPLPEALDLAILHDDAHVLAVDKPAGLVAHPAYKHASGTLLNAVLWRAREEAEPWTPRLVHRLDKQTSGVLVVAKSVEAHAALLAAWRSGAFTKHYLAVVIGHPPRRRGEIRLRLDRDLVDRRRVVVSPTWGRDCFTRFELIAASRGARAGVSLLCCELVTGRMHQLRVHLSAVGLPIVGDAVYGAARVPLAFDARLATAVRSFPRQALHAWRVRGPDPVAATTLDVCAPLPDDMRTLLTVAGIDADAALERLARLGTGGA
jgi:23S rRNA pseudouridine1911/1915/1917 synthase